MSSPPLPPKPGPTDGTLPEQQTVAPPPADTRQIPPPGSPGAATFPAEAAALLRQLKLTPPDETLTGGSHPSGIADGGTLPDAPGIPGYELLCELGRGGMG